MGRRADHRRHVKRCRWLKPQLVGTIEFLEWTPDGRLRHPKFVAVRDDRIPQEITQGAALDDRYFPLQ